MQIIRLVVTSLLLAFVSGIAAGQTNKAAGASDRIEKVSRQMVWAPEPDGIQLPLWPANLAIQKPEIDKPEEVGNGSRLVAGRPWHWASYVSRPTMTIYRPKGRNTRAAILVLPGGGYQAVAMDLEGTEVCDLLTKQGITCVLLKYRVPQTWRHDGVEQAPKVQLPLQDAQRAMGLLRHQASYYDIDPHKIGVIGFSAGGHLAAAVSNAEKRTYELVDAADRQPSLPDFAILLYPGHLWDETSPKTSLMLSSWVEISKNAPRTLLIHSMNDPVDDVRHSMAYGLALNDVGVPVEMHLYATGGHAFGMRVTSAPITTEWPKLVMDWLQSIKVL
ncbi:alpha/beta hydrolase [candidate division KSB1 bacterium]|nr:alpha/beta hydrolase [candidate division KSB1 bacterium]